MIDAAARVSRRWFLGAGAATVAALAGCGDDGEGTAAATTSTTSTTSTSTTSTTSTSTASTATTAGAGAAGSPAALTVADFTALGTCALLPETTSGPFPLDEQFDRLDITEGYPGLPMRLGFRVVDEGCAAIPGAVVEVWHCDATGDYSAFADGGGGKDEAEGTTFLRGSRTADADGIVDFQTIVPGWYSGRAVHIHLRVHLDGATVLTSQVYFDAAFLEGAYAAEPYAAFGAPDTSNEDDGIAGDAEGDGTILHTTEAETHRGSGVLALLNLGVDPGAA